LIAGWNILKDRFLCFGGVVEFLYGCTQLPESNYISGRPDRFLKPVRFNGKFSEREAKNYYAPKVMN